ncbi:MAG: hypothetical protein Q8L66_15435 [Caulobacter sp.]|nr:hypothetical protein [Caulobacter sp.]
MDTLERAVNSGGVNGPLAAIAALVEAEAADRSVRGVVLAPIAPLFGPPADNDHLRFPRGAFVSIWAGLKAEAPDLVREAVSAARYLDPDEASPAVFNRLCARAAAGLEAGSLPEYAGAIAACAAARPTAAAELILCLKLVPVVRPALQKLPDWIQRMTDERRATARLAYRDATSLGEGGGPLLFEMLAASLEQPWLVLRVVSAVMDHPGERYLAESELARFGERTLDHIEAQLGQVSAVKAGAGVASSRQAGAAVQRALEAVAELEQSVQLAKDGPWGRRLIKLKQSIAGAVESRLRDIEAAAAKALPVEKIKYSARLTRTAPRLSQAPDRQAIDATMGLLAFADSVRACSADGGFGSARTKALDALAKWIDQYVEDLLEQVRLGELEDDSRAREFLGVAASLLALARDEQSAVIVRRRAAAA